MNRLAAQVFDHEPASDLDHQVTCEHCQRALRSLERLARDLEEVARLKVRVPERLVKTIVARIRNEPLAVAVDSTRRGRTSVSTFVLADLARAAAQAVDGVVLASAGAELTGDEPPRVALDVRLVAELDRPFEALAEAVRERVRSAVEERSGAAVARVDVMIDDVA